MCQAGSPIGTRSSWQETSNSSLSRQPRLAGLAVLVPQDKRPDEPELANFLCNHRMVPLNTAPHTFAQGETRTQIDFVPTREVSASRQIQIWWGAGKRHFLPVTATVAPVRHWHLPGPQIKPIPRLCRQPLGRHPHKHNTCLIGYRSAWIRPCTLTIGIGCCRRLLHTCSQKSRWHCQTNGGITFD